MSTAPPDHHLQQSAQGYMRSYPLGPISHPTHVRNISDSSQSSATPSRNVPLHHLHASTTGHYSSQRMDPSIAPSSSERTYEPLHMRNDSQGSGAPSMAPPTDFQAGFPQSAPYRSRTASTDALIMPQQGHNPHPAFRLQQLWSLLNACATGRRTWMKDQIMNNFSSVMAGLDGLSGVILESGLVSDAPEFYPRSFSQTAPPMADLSVYPQRVSEEAPPPSAYPYSSLQPNERSPPDTFPPRLQPQPIAFKTGGAGLSTSASAHQVPTTSTPVTKSRGSSATINPSTAATAPTQSSSRSKKPPRDPRMPKQPMTSYLLYCRDVREDVKAKFPNMTQTEVATQMGRMWNEVPEDNKKRYDEMAHLLRDQYNNAMMAYRMQQALENSGASGTPTEDATHASHTQAAHPAIPDTTSVSQNDIGPSIPAKPVASSNGATPGTGRQRGSGKRGRGASSSHTHPSAIAPLPFHVPPRSP
ncbi:hypothetical protein BC829DRAFT_255933 [Chytridium lagenaria]|nr:hypothetical protein BC829DRAFT_255933 [Chytridium lagenaria]